MLTLSLYEMVRRYRAQFDEQFIYLCDDMSEVGIRPGSQLPTEIMITGRDGVVKVRRVFDKLDEEGDLMYVLYRSDVQITTKEGKRHVSYSLYND